MQAYDLHGAWLGETALGAFDGPSSVLPAKGRLGLGWHDLLVTEKGANRLAVYGFP